ncbi:MAG: protein kinase [Ilumatobacteraceae bacterium]|jgi:eukaryotic-like serine/threonine-protein kinase|nr:protein kinase [Ilumatobacteraceae bacterium]
MSPSLVPNTLIGARYRLVRRIGQGGMAEVWLAKDTSLDRDVAVKVMRAHHDDDHVGNERFRREAKASAALSSPNIVTVYDVVEDAGRQAVVMEYINGQSLRELLDKQDRISPSLTVHIGMAVASALDAAHAKDLVHRDIKPANILITPAGRVLLTDFGIAKTLSGNESDLTNDNIMMGTAKYLSPEQVSGKKLDGRADLYSLGLVLYECLAGRVPFVGGTDVETALARVQGDAPDILKIRPTLQPLVANIIHQMLARDPDQRQPSGEAVRAALYRAREIGLDGTPTGLTPPHGNAVPESAREILRDLEPATSPTTIPGEPVISNPTARAKTARSASSSRPVNKALEKRAHRITPTSMLAAAVAIGVVLAGVVLWRSVSSPSTKSPVASASTTPVATGPVNIVAVSSYDPDGDDNSENDDLIPNLRDGKSGTQWRTVCYGNNQFGSKKGVGFVAELSGRSTGTLFVDFGYAPWEVDVYGYSDTLPSKMESWGPALARSESDDPGEATFTISQPSQFILVYLRSAARSPQCSTKNPFQGVVNDISFVSASAP